MHPSDHLCALLLGFWAAGAASLVCPTAVPALFACLKAYPFVLAIAKGLVAFPLSFHWFAGLRHLVRIYLILLLTGVPSLVPTLKVRFLVANFIVCLWP